MNKFRPAFIHLAVGVIGQPNAELPVHCFEHMMQHSLKLALSFIALARANRAKFSANKSSLDVPVVVQSGISASGLMCLSVQGGCQSSSRAPKWHDDACLSFQGHVASDGAAVVLEDCVRAVAAGDGRELWKIQQNGQLVTVVGGKCAGLVDNDVSGHVALMDCDAALKTNDGRSQFEILGKGQIKLGQGDLCLSQSGPGAGRRNVAAKAAATATSSFNVAHGRLSRD